MWLRGWCGGSSGSATCPLLIIVKTRHRELCVAAQSEPLQVVTAYAMALIASSDIEPSVFPSSLISPTTPPIDWSVLDQTSSGGGNTRGDIRAVGARDNRPIGDREAREDEGKATTPWGSVWETEVAEGEPPLFLPSSGDEEARNATNRGLGKVGEANQPDNEFVPSPSRLSRRKKGKARATEELKSLGKDTGKLVMMSGKRGKPPGKRLTELGNKRKTRTPSTDEEPIRGETSVDEESSDDELRLRPSVGRPVLKKAKTTARLRRPPEIFDGVLVPGRPGPNFEGEEIDEDTAVDPMRVPQVVGAVSGTWCCCSRAIF